MHSTCLCCGHSNTQIGAAEVEQQKEMKKMQQWTETGQKRKDSGIVKVERRASGREQSSPLAAAAATSGKRRVQKSSLGFCNMYSVGDRDIGQDDLMLS